MTARGLRRFAAGAWVALGLGGAGVACPARDLSVRITGEGIETVVLACESFRTACTKGQNGKCNRNLLLCDPATCKPRNACEIEGNPDWAAEKVMAVRLLVVEARDGVPRLRHQSKCVALNLKPCVRELGCADAPADARGCITDRTSAAVTEALGDGLTFDGFNDLEGVLLAMAVYRKRVDEESCGEATVDEEDCTTTSLVAGLGLAPPVGGSVYDITCASCQGGTHASFGRDNGPCPVTNDACFLQQMAELLERKD